MVPELIYPIFDPEAFLTFDPLNYPTFDPELFLIFPEPSTEQNIDPLEVLRVINNK